MEYRKIILLMASMAMTGIAFSQTLHNIMFCATQDPKIGVSCEVDNDRAQEETTDISTYIGYKKSNYVYNGAQCTKANLDRVISTLQSSGQDVIIFYYSGHGTHAAGQTGDPYPQMVLNEKSQQNYVPVSKVVKELNKKPHGLLIVLSDCCNNLADWVTPKSVIEAQNTVTVARSNEAANYKRLFVESKGQIIATGCKLGQYSLCTKEDGGFFSTSFWDALFSECSEGNNPSWLNIMRNTAKKTSSMASFGGDKQDPYFDVNLTSGPGVTINTPTIPTPVPNPTPIPSPTTISTDSPFAISLSRMIAIPNTEQRLGMIPQMMSTYFANGGHIVTLGRNLQTIVDYEDADKFLRRIASNPKILKINVIKEQVANDGLPYITVTEMRKP